MFENTDASSHNNINAEHNWMSNSKIVLILIIAIVMLLIGYKQSTTVLTYKEYTSYGSLESDLTFVSLETNNDELCQTFSMPYDILTSIAIRIGTFERDNNSEWNVYLYETESNQKIFQKQFNASLIKDNDYYEIKLPRNLRVDKNNKYTLIIQAKNATEISKLAFYIDPNSATGENHLNHEGKIIPGQLVMKIYGGNIDYWWFGFYCLVVFVLLFALTRTLWLAAKSKNPLKDKLIQALIIGIVFFLLRYSFSVGEIFTDENDNIRGGLVIANGGILYKDYIVQHTPVMYYICSVFALIGAHSVGQFRLSYYLLEATIWGCAYLRYSRFFGGKRIALIPILEAVCISTIVGSQGYQILSDGWQGMVFVILLLEFLQYYKERTLDWRRCIIISICIWGSFGAAFISAYPLLPLALIVLLLEIQYWRKSDVSFKLLVQRYYRFLIAVVLPLAGAIIYFKINSVLQKAYEQCYTFNREVYPKYVGGLGSKIIQPFVNGVQNFFGIIADNFNSIINATATNITILQLIIIVASVVVLIKMFEEKRYVESSAIFLVMVFSATRGYGFHGLAAWYIATMIVAMNLNLIKRLIPKAGTATITVVCIVLASTYVNQVGNNLLSEPQSVSELEMKVVELTDNDEDKDVFIDAYSCDSIYLFYKGRKPVNPAVYMLPWYMDWYEDDNIEALTERKPRVIIYNEDRDCWGYTHYNNKLDAVIEKNYTRLGNENSGWKYSVWVRNE